MVSHFAISLTDGLAFLSNLFHTSDVVFRFCYETLMDSMGFFKEILSSLRFYLDFK